MKNPVALACGILFGFGLAVSGMTDTVKVIGFLDLFGEWAPDLAFVMAGAVCVTFIGYRLVFKSNKPILDAEFHLPTKTALDTRLVLGAMIFGIGWGLYGYCPGPAIASIAYLKSDTMLFLLSMLFGMFMVSAMDKYLKL